MTVTQKQDRPYIKAAMCSGRTKKTFWLTEMPQIVQTKATLLHKVFTFTKYFKLNLFYL